MKVESFAYREKDRELQRLRVNLARMSSSGEEMVKVRGEGRMKQLSVIIERKARG